MARQAQLCSRAYSDDDPYLGYLPILLRIPACPARVHRYRLVIPLEQALFASIFLLPFGTFLMVIGLLVYNGRFLAFRAGLNSFWSGEPALASTYIGLFLILIPLWDMANTANVNEFLELVVACVILGSGFVGLIGGFWMPNFLKPRFIRKENAERKQARQAERDRRRKMSAGSVNAD